ncbi:hypothetical protein LTR37_008510 [Vermiconidia calcicola]|uniref:Uncharacterized protein n=1 Tax=Vermiconidia calcicola TaxID=1690605 RepID=A0ACC3ND24_9PEZI|nr:hypothetical protein LTR37_008510 [Vermiconidia calcicola]
MFAGAFAASANNATITVDPSKDMDASLKEIFSAQRGLLDNTLELAVGGEGDYSTLPDQAGDYSMSVARFMADGKFLLQGDLVEDYFSTGYDFLNKKLVDVAIQVYGYQVLADHNYEDADSCATQYGAFWMDIDGGRCMPLVYQDGDANVYWPVSNDIIDTAQDKYSFNMFDYYIAACDCAVNGSGEPDINALPGDGSPPQCFYNIPCQDAEVCLESDDEWSICWPISFEEVMSFDD